MLNTITLFLTGFIQVYFVSINTYFLAKEMYIGVLTASFMISIIWSYNIKKIAFGTTKDRILYAMGASLGSVAGLKTSTIIFSSLLKM